MDYLAGPVTDWLHPKDCPPPKAKKILLYLNTGITTTGCWSDLDCLLWMPLPKISSQMKQRLERENERTVIKG